MASSAVPSRLLAKVDKFKDNVTRVFSQNEPTRIVMVTAWLVSDNVMIDLFHRFTSEMPQVVAVDTLHLFRETLEVAQEMQRKYNFEAHVYKPLGCDTLQDFEQNYGNHHDLSFADFDKYSKIDPMIQAFEDLKKVVTITGRRCDQGNARVELEIWEEEKNTFNPLASWSWKDICDYVIAFDVPFNALHRRLSISTAEVHPLQRDKYSQWRHVDLEKPYFAYSKKEVEAMGPVVYVWKSFGDTHTSIPVLYDESERSGRFVGRNQTECGIHTRIVDKFTPHGGKLIDLCVTGEDASSLLSKATHQIVLNDRQVCDFELLAVGGFSPLTGFMNESVYDEVVKDMRLPEGQLFGLPVTLDTKDESIEVGDFIQLLHPPTRAVGVLHVESKWKPDRLIEASKVYGTTNIEHPAVMHLLEERMPFNIGGRVYAISLPQREWVNCISPQKLRSRNEGKGNLVAFQSRNPLHRAHVEMFMRVHRDHNAAVLVHPVIGPTKSDDVPPTIRKQTYDALASQLDMIQFEYLPYNMIVGGPREALQHAIVRKNYGCTGIIIGRDHAGCNDASGKPFYGPYDAQDLLQPLSRELGMDIVPFHLMVYCNEVKSYLTIDEANAKQYKPLTISGTQFRKLLEVGGEIPSWFAYPEVVSILRKHYVQQRFELESKHKQESEVVSQIQTEV